MPQSPPQRLIVGISGASGVIYGIRALQALADSGVETHLVVSKSAEMTMGYETDIKPADVRSMATHFHPVGDVGASIASGSFRTMGMLILPCSVRTMGEIATGVTSTLLTRAADVVLTGATSGEVAGSLVFETSAITFIKSGGPLAADD